MSAPPKLPPARSSAMTCFLSNLAVPGAGSLRAGWRVSGWLQLVLAFTGLGLSLAFGAWFAAEWLRSGQLPTTTILERGEMPPEFLKYLIIGGGGLGLFVLALGWAALTSLLVWRESEGSRRG